MIVSATDQALHAHEVPFRPHWEMPSSKTCSITAHGGRFHFTGSGGGADPVVGLQQATEKHTKTLLNLTIKEKFESVHSIRTMRPGVQWCSGMVASLRTQQCRWKAHCKRKV